MQLSVCCETVFTDLPFEERCAAIRQLGVDAIELWHVPGTAAVPVVGPILQASGCRLELFCGNRWASLIDPAERQLFLGMVAGNLEAAVQLGCPQLTMLSDRVDDHGIPILPRAVLTDAQKTASMLHGLREATRLAEAANVTLLLEPLNTKVDHPGFTLCHSAPAFEIVRTIGSPRLKVLYDVYHMQIMEGNLIATLEANLDAIGHIHVADVPGRHEPGTGEINYRDIARMLQANGYSGRVGLECVPKTDSATAIRAFQTVFG